MTIGLSLAQQLLGLLPPLDERDGLEVAAIRSITGQAMRTDNVQSWRQRTLRNPHHSCSAAALVGGSVSSHNRCKFPVIV